MTNLHCLRPLSCGDVLQQQQDTTRFLSMILFLHVPLTCRWPPGLVLPPPLTLCATLGNLIISCVLNRHLEMLPSPTSAEIRPAGEQRAGGGVLQGRADRTETAGHRVGSGKWRGGRAEAAGASLALCFPGWGLGGSPLGLLGARGLAAFSGSKDWAFPDFQTSYAKKS